MMFDVGSWCLLYAPYLQYQAMRQVVATVNQLFSLMRKGAFDLPIMCEHDVITEFHSVPREVVINIIYTIFY